MCGVAGVVRPDRTWDLDASLDLMIAFMRERGPDAFGKWTDERVGLGHTRLSIIDLRAEANQPFIDAASGLVLVFNGEIYNFLDLRRRLESEGCAFRTTSDTEVILQGYQRWGEALLGELDGMFAFALYDQKKKNIVLARDPFGKKPLYYYTGAGPFLFASDIRSVARLIPGSLRLDYVSLDYYLSESSSPQPRTIWSEIQQVEPGTMLRYDLDKSGFVTKRFFELQPSDEFVHAELDTVIEATEEKLTRAIAKRLVADVPVASFLSGGVDSGLIVSLQSSHSDEPVNTFTCGFKDERFDERDQARKVVDKYGTNHLEEIVDADYWEDLPELIDYFGEPFADYSNIPTYLISQKISEQYKVVLSGDGGDELFGGYNDYGLAARSELFYNQNGSGLLRSTKVIADKIRSRFLPSKENFGAYEHYMSISGGSRLFRQMGFHPDEKKKLYAGFPKEFTSSSIDLLQDIWDRTVASSDTDRLMISSLSTRLLNDYLVKVDRSSMKNSLEVRSPFLDKDLANFAFSIPWYHKFHEGHAKYILKKLAQKYFAPDVFHHSKRGFSVPVGDWIHDNRDLVYGTLSKSSGIFSELFSGKYIKDLLDYHLKVGNQSRKIWILVVLAKWLDLQEM